MNRFSRLPSALLLAVALPVLSACSATSKVRIATPSSKPPEKAPLTVAWTLRPGDECGPFDVGFSCFAKAYVRLEGAESAYGELLDANFERVLRTGDAKAPGADLIAKTAIDEHNVSLWLNDSATGENYLTFRHGIQPAFYASDSSICALTMVTFTWFLFPSYAKGVADHYAGAYAGNLSAYFTQLNDYLQSGYVKDLAEHIQASKRALPLEREADAALARGDKAEAFRLLARAAPGLWHRTQTGRRVVGKLVPLIPHGEAPEIPELARKLTVQGQTQFKDGRHDQAIESFTEVLEQAPWWPSAWFNLGIAQEGAKRHKEAAATFERYLQAAPDAADAEEVKKRAWALQAK